MLDPRFVSFVLVSALLIVAPGPDMALVTRNALAHGRRAATITAGGVCLGLLFWAGASAAGVGLVLERSVLAFTVLKLAGAAYLTYLGCRSLLSTRGKGRTETPAGRTASRPLGGWQAFRQGALGNLLNAKAAVIWVSILPQFVHPNDSPLRLVAMVAVFEVMELVWLTFYGAMVSKAGETRMGVQVRRLLGRATGLVLIGLGVRLAFERR